MAPQYASFLVGLGSIALSLGYILNPILMGVIVSNHVSKNSALIRNDYINLK